MDQDKFMKLQYQMKQNSAELQDFLNDLDHWESDIKLKDEKLKSERHVSEKDVSRHLLCTLSALNRPS